MNHLPDAAGTDQSDIPHDSKDIFLRVYNELRKLAEKKMSREMPGQSLSATALVHEVFVRLTEDGFAKEWGDDAYFFAAAAEAMRRILVESARRRRSLKRGGDRERVSLDEAIKLPNTSSDNLLELDEALTELARREPQKAELVKLRYFAGLTIDEAATVLGISRATAKRYWSYAKAWLFDRLHPGD